LSTVQSIADELLVIRCRQGDAEALDLLLRRWQEPLWRHALRVTGQEAAAWDVLQEALVIISRDIHKLEIEAAFGAWAYRITGHKAQDWLRQNLRRQDREKRFAEQQSIDKETADLPLAESEALREQMSRLEIADRTLLSLRFENGFTLDEIAQMLGIPTGTVKSRLHTVRQRLRTLMKGKI
jgi:RNA polymerase sigma-70 factor (ECF subfamily)